MKNRTIIKDEIDFLRKAGLKATPSRLAILHLFKKSSRPLSVHGVIEKIEKKTIDPVTVYRTIKHLVEKGILRQVDLRHQHAHFEMALQDDHHHIVCEVCGHIEDVAECHIQEIQDVVVASSRRFKTIRQHSLEFFGICTRCQK